MFQTLGQNRRADDTPVERPLAVTLAIIYVIIDGLINWFFHFYNLLSYPEPSLLFAAQQVSIEKYIILNHVFPILFLVAATGAWQKIRWCYYWLVYLFLTQALTLSWAFIYEMNLLTNPLFLAQTLPKLLFSSLFAFLLFSTPAMKWLALTQAGRNVFLRFSFWGSLLLSALITLLIQ
ncbi:MAG: hypothetical protein OEX00_00850 [Gammaproteobacteria bacterium]|nr:hypothetical protein [Gammaproteobacteria bacterium]MDH5692673.1 hypothetical protein [Gammaproteobacteria bacterium]